MTDQDKLKRLDDPIARKKRKMEEALARKRAKSEGSEDTTGGSSDLLSSASSDLTHSATSEDTTQPDDAASPTAATPTAASPTAASPIAASPIATTPADTTPAATPASTTPAATPASATPAAATPAAATPAAATPSAGAAGTPPTGGAVTPTPAADMMAVQCPACGNSAQIPKRFVGQLIKCAECSAALRLEPTGAVLAPAVPTGAAPSAPTRAQDDVAGVPIPVVAGIAAIVLLFLLALAFRSDPETGPEASPSDVAASPSPSQPASPSPTAEPTAQPTTSPSGSPTPAATPRPTANQPASPSPTASRPPSPSPTASQAASPSPTAAASPDPSAAPTKCLLGGQVHFQSEAGLPRRAPSHPVRIVRNAGALLARLPEHQTAYEAAVQAGLAELRTLDPTLPPAEYTAEAKRRQRRMQRNINEVVRSFRLELRRLTVAELTTNGQGRFELELDPGDYLIVSDAFYPIGDQRLAFFEPVTLKVGVRSLKIVGDPADVRARLLVEREVLPEDE